MNLVYPSIIKYEIVIQLLKAMEKCATPTWI